MATDQEYQEQVDSFSRSLKAAIDKNGMTQRKLARKLGLSNSAINGWCNGRSAMSLVTATTVANALGMTLDETFCHDPEKELSIRSQDRRKSALTEAYSRAGVLLASYGALSPDARSRIDAAIALELAKLA